MDIARIILMLGVSFFLISAGIVILLLAYEELSAETKALLIRKK